MNLNIISTIGPEPISLTEAKEYLRVDFDDDDSLINMIIIAARHTVESQISQHIVEREWNIVPDHLYETNTFDVPYVSEITGVSDGVVDIVNDYTATLKQHSFQLDIEGDVSEIETPVITGTLVYPFGETLKIAMLMLIVSFYENRNAVVMTSASELPLGVKYVLAPHTNIKAG